MLLVLARNWWALALRGLAAIIFGVLTFIWPEITLIVLVVLFGGFVLADGVLSVVAALLRAGKEKRWWALLLQGILGIAVGVLTFFWPGLTALGLLYLIAAWAIVIEALEIATAVALRKHIEGEWLLGLIGALSILFGLYATIFPVAGALSVVLIIGIYVLASGVLMVVLAFKLRGLAGRLQQVTGDEPGMVTSR